MRIISGKHRGRRILMHPGKEIRPTSGMAREAIFNILMHADFGPGGISPVAGCHIIDLFCGSGALGLEALSRGAAHVTFVDQSQQSIELARQNVTLFHEEENCRFIRSDSTVLPRAATPCELALMDPPYKTNLATPALTALHNNGWLVPGAIVVVEIHQHQSFTPPEPYEIFDSRRYGKAQIHLLRYSPPRVN